MGCAEALASKPQAQSSQGPYRGRRSRGVDQTAQWGNTESENCQRRLSLLFRSVVPCALPERVVLLDDVASSGHTVAGAAQLLRAAGTASVDVAVTHALFAGDAMQVLQDAGVAEVWSTDCVTHPSNAVSVTPVIARALHALAGDRAPAR